MHARHLFGLAFLASSCTPGTLILPEGIPPIPPCATSAECSVGFVCVDAVCVVSPGACNAAFPDGDCSLGWTCDNGACRRDGTEVTPGPWCTECTEPDQGCDGKECRVIDSSNECTPSRPDGVCPGSDVCVGGYCVTPPAGEECSDARPQGYCPADTTCVNGRCRAVSDDRCSESNPTGLCEPGFKCVSPGSCQLDPCGAGAPTGACAQDEVCSATAPGGSACVDLPCGPSHTGGACSESMKKCCQAGRCIDDTLLACCVTADCPDPESTFCRSDGLCTPIGRCKIDGDCLLFDPHNHCVNQTCERNYDCPTGTECLADEHCIADAACPSGNCCRALTVCAVNEDCNMGEYCCSDRQCKPWDAVNNKPAECCQASDCNTGAGEICTGGKHCGICDADGDCPPSHTCVLNACVPAGDCNASVVYPPVAGCDTSHGETTCCPPGALCCPRPYEQRCSASDACIGLNQCVTDLDCISGYTTCRTGCDRSTDPTCYTCVPITCIDASTCPNPATDQCVNGHCLPGSISPPGGGTCSPCLSSRDCGPFDFCDENHCCTACLNVSWSPQLVKPNMLVVLDRSGSMQVVGGGSGSFVCEPGGTSLCACGDVCSQHDGNQAACTGDTNCTWVAAASRCDDNPNTCTKAGSSRLADAQGAIAAVMDSKKDQIRFGFTAYPRQCLGAQACTRAGNWASCDGWDCRDCSGCCSSSLFSCAPSVCEWLASSCSGGGLCSTYTSSWECLANGCTPTWFERSGYSGTCAACANTSTAPNCNTAGACPGTALTHRTNCTGKSSNYEAGLPIKVPVNDYATVGTDIVNALNATMPGGATPTGATMRGVRDAPSSAGLADTDRGNYVLLVTDGEANGDFLANVADPSSTSGGLCDNTQAGFNCKVNSVLKDLLGLTYPIKTYVVGFSFVSPALNCYAYWGGTARTAECPTLDGTNCGLPDTDPSHPCPVGAGSEIHQAYYSASDQATLVAAFNDIVSKVASCTFSLPQPAPNPNLVFVSMVRSIDGVTYSITKDTSHTNGWDWKGSLQFELFGPPCDEVKANTHAPKAEFGCCIIGEGGQCQ